VSFGSQTTYSFTIDSDTQITVTAPLHTPGTVDVTVFRDGVTSSTSAADQFTYVAVPPVVTGVNPNWGPTSGGTPVLITGTGFLAVSSVVFGTFSAPWFQVDSDTQIEAISPAEPAGTVDIIVFTWGGSSDPVLADHFTYVDGGHGGGGGFSSRARHVGKPSTGVRARGHHRHPRRPHGRLHRAHRLERRLLPSELRALEAFFAEGITVG
jgi:hypothetical protein